MADSQLPSRWNPAASQLSLGSPSNDKDGSNYEPVTPPAGEESLLRLVLEMLALLRRNWILVLATTAASLGYGVYRVKQQVPSYKASAVIRIASRSPLAAGSPGAPAAFNSPIPSLIQVLQSRSVAEAVAADIGRRLQPATPGFAPSLIRDAHVDSGTPDGTIRLHFYTTRVDASGGGERVSGAYGAPIELRGVRFVVVAQPPGINVADLSVVPLESAAAQILGSVYAIQRSGTDLVDVYAVDGDPYRAKWMVNSAVRMFQEVDARRTNEALRRRREFIQQQLDKAEMRVAEGQMALASFQGLQQEKQLRGEIRVVPSSDVSALAQRNLEYQGDRTRIVAFLDSNATSLRPGGRDRLASLIASLVSASPSVSLSYSQLTRNQGTRDSLTSGVWPRSVQDPDVRGLDIRIASNDSAVFHALRSQMSAIDARLAALDEVRRRVIQQISNVPQTQVQEDQLVAQLGAYHSEANGLRGQLQAAQITEAAEVGQVEIVDLAVSPGGRQVSGRTPQIAFAVIMGLALGGILGYVLENYRPVIRRRDELDRAVAIPNLAVVPRIHPIRPLRRPLLGNGSSNGRGQRVPTAPALVTDLVTLNEPRSSAAEAYRTLRTNLLFSAPVFTLKRIIVTSAGPKEGKSTTTVNLAVVLAQQGFRVLIIDCDLRRPRIHKIFQFNAAPGLTNVLIGSCVPADALQRTPIDNLVVMTAGTAPPNPAELLGGPKMEALLTDLGANYDIIIMDTPPLLAASDAAILGRNADGTVIVVRAGETQRAAVREGIDQLAKVGARVLGTVLNDPDAEVAKYATNYYTYYNNYYDYSATE